MRLIVFILAGLAVGTLGGTAIRGIKEKDRILERLAAEKAAAAAAAHQEGAASEALLTPGHGSEEAGGMGEGSNEGEVPVSNGDPPHPQEAEPAPEGGSASAEADATASPTTLAAETPFDLGKAGPWDPSQALGPDEGPARLAKIFGAMQARDAAAVLEKLDDGEVRAILHHLSDRKAAEILGAFSPERAAALSRAVLLARSGSGS